MELKYLKMMLSILKIRKKFMFLKVNNHINKNIIFNIKKGKILMNLNYLLNMKLLSN